MPSEPSLLSVTSKYEPNKSCVTKFQSPFFRSVEDLPSYISKRILTIQGGKLAGSHLLFQ